MGFAATGLGWRTSTATGVGWGVSWPSTVGGPTCPDPRPPTAPVTGCACSSSPTPTSSNVRLVLDQPPADGSPSYRLPLGASGLSVEETVTGGVVLHERQVRRTAVFRGVSARMWDAQRDDADDPILKRSVSLSLTGARQGPRRGPTRLLADRRTQYPVTIDPDFALRSRQHLPQLRPARHQLRLPRTGCRCRIRQTHGIFQLHGVHLKGTHVTQVTCPSSTGQWLSVIRRPPMPLSTRRTAPTRPAGTTNPR